VGLVALIRTVTATVSITVLALIHTVHCTRGKMNSTNQLDQSLIEVSMEESSIDVLCMACNDQSCDFKSVKLQRRDCGDEDIEIAMKYCGVCHSDLHTAAGHLSGVTELEYPCVLTHTLTTLIRLITHLPPKLGSRA